ncbi:helix-turn-helix domain-containing protein [Chitinophaga eiseniae]|uniref:helix-turn-helix domain-containing protein n=1 Tax=Chitinophaga eiseniae TaxID=634771 RepID=UPI00099A3E76
MFISNLIQFPAAGRPSLQPFCDSVIAGKIYSRPIWAFQPTRLCCNVLTGCSNVPIKHIAEELGYSSIQYFSKMFKKKFGFSPGLFSKDAQD